MNTCVSVESMNAQIIADDLENGFSYSHATEMVNISCAKQGLQHLGILSVHDCAQIMNPIRTAIGKSKQGSSDPESPWTKSRLQWITQYAIRLGT